MPARVWCSCSAAPQHNTTGHYVVVCCLPFVIAVRLSLVVRCVRHTTHLQRSHTHFFANAQSQSQRNEWLLFVRLFYFHISRPYLTDAQILHFHTHIRVNECTLLARTSQKWASKQRTVDIIMFENKVVEEFCVSGSRALLSVCLLSLCAFFFFLLFCSKEFCW